MAKSGLRLSEELYAEQCAKRARWQKGSVINADQRPAAVTPRGAGNAAGAPPLAPSAAAGHLSIVLPLPPSVNVLYGTNHGTGQKFLTSEQRAFRARAAQLLREMGAVALAGRLEMRVTLYFANRRRADIDNRLKAVFDACKHGGAYLDDSQIDVLFVERIVRRGGEEECAVVVREMAA